MNTAPPLEYVTSFAEASQTMMQRLTTALITSGEFDADFSRFAEVASIQQNYLSQMGGLWGGNVNGIGGGVAEGR